MALFYAESSPFFYDPFFLLKNRINLASRIFNYRSKTVKICISDMSVHNFENVLNFDQLFNNFPLDGRLRSQKKSCRDHKKHPVQAGFFILNKLNKLASESI